ncbi:MAG: endonuclease VIII [bacterium]|nr:endonuclease VIII [bacterium]
MPEGPEIRQAADEIRRALTYKDEPVREVWFKFEELKPFEKKLRNKTVYAVEPRAKALLIRFEGGWNIYSHNQLYGKWFVRKTESGEPKTGRDLRVILRNHHRQALLYSASNIAVLHDDELAEHPFLRSLGPDVLDAQTRPEQVRDRLLDQRFRGRGLGALYLDQSFLAGPGNYLRSEILFFAGLHPKRRPRDLDETQIAALARLSLDISRRAYNTRGVTNEAERVARLKAEGATRSAYRHAVFAREGRTCYECGARIQKIDVASRRLYYCPRCQPE